MAVMEGEGSLRTTRRSNLESLARQGEPDAIAELAAIPGLPPAGLHVWNWFIELGATRQFSEAGPSPLSRLDIRQWETDECRTLEFWERRLILQMDAMWRRSATAPAKGGG